MNVSTTRTHSRARQIMAGAPPSARPDSKSDQIIEQALLTPVHAFVQTSGKQIRRAMVQLAYTLAGGEGPAPKPICEAVEWLHAGSLIIDDIEDESTCRRGQPTLHRTLGLPLALNAGNWMYFRAMEMLLDAELSPQVQAAALREFVTTCRECHEGQALDLSARIDQLPAAQLESVASCISRRKTGSLVALSTSLGAIGAGGDRFLVSALAQFGSDVGVALQMRNDLAELETLAQLTDNPLHAASTAGCRADPRFDDLRFARVTWPWAWAAGRCTRDEFSCLLGQSVAIGQDPKAAARVARSLLEICQAVAEPTIQSQVDQALRLLGEHVVAPSLMDDLRKVLDSIVRPIREVQRATIR